MTNPTTDGGDGDSGGVRYRSILHPTDFSQASATAFAHALRLAVSGHGGLTVLHADERDEAVDWGDFPGVRDTLARWGELPEGAAPDDVPTGVRKLRWRGGEPVGAILHRAEADPPDLVVLATHGREGLRRLTHKSVAEPVARRVGGPTLLLPHGAAGFVDAGTGAVRLRRVLIPIAKTPRAAPAVEAAATLLRTLSAEEAELRLLYVGEEGDAPALTLPRPPGWRWERQVEEGQVVPTIVRVVEAWDPDVIAMTTRGHDSLLDVLFGSTAEQVLRQAGRPLLAVPDRE